MRDPIAVVIRPNMAELMFVLGRPHCGLFKRLMASARSINVVRSLIRTFLLNAMSRPRVPGPFTPGKFKAVLPVVPGFVRAALTPGGQVANPTLLDSLYTYAWFVTFALSFVLYLIGGQKTRRG